ncbi:acid sphingomyelinase-like phosphodiesterase 3b isoform X2 [Glandiceps talaboti]
MWVSLSYIWHVTDFHYDPDYTAGDYPASSCRDLGGETPNYWGDYRCDSPWALINSSVYAMQAIKEKPDFIIWTGDDTPHVPNDNLSTQKVINIISNLTSLLMDAFPNIKVFPVLGNHDYHPKHMMPPEPNDVYGNVTLLWDEWLNPYSDALNTFKQAAYYTAEYKPGQRIVGLNTVYYYTNDKVTEDMDDPGDQFQWLESVLQNATEKNEKVYIIGHVPPGKFERHAGKSWFYERFNKRYIEIVRKFHDVITGQFYAHQHDDSFRLFYDETGNPVNSLFLAPAVTPWNTTLSGVGPNNPGIRLFEFDRNTWEILDIKQYYLDLATTGDLTTSSWELEYSAKSAYAIPDVTTPSLQQLVDSFRDQSSTTFDKYYLYNSVSYDKSKCDAQCKVEQLCAVTEVDFDEYASCLADGLTGNAVRPLATLFVQAVMFVLQYLL